MPDYHEREAVRDLRRLARLLGDLESTPADTASKARHHRSCLGDALCLLEHLVEERLGGRLHERDPRNFAHRDRTDLQTGLHKMLALAVSVLPDTVASDPLIDDVHPAVAEAHELAAALHRHLDPAAAGQEDRDLEIATPLRYRRHPRARELEACPHCAAPLEPGDRTFTGSYCENCRTRWDLVDELPE